LLIQVYYFIKPTQEGILSIYFHNPSRVLFEKILKWLVKHGYNFISIEELKKRIDQKANSTKSVVLTFDDGWKKNLELLDLIEKYKIPITIFVPTDSIIQGNYWFEYARIKGQQTHTKVKTKKLFKKLPGDIFIEKVEILKQNYSLPRSCITFEELRKLSENVLITIGSHTVSHPILNNCSYQRQTIELQESKQVLSNWLNKDIESIAYPNGNYNQNTIEIAKRCGYKLGFTVNPGKIDVNNVDPYLIPRNAMYDDGGYFENISKILGIWQNVISPRN
jgi:poly-beta-1,6-N-acetyl-D-glucosamine N-deacetylase